MRGAWLAGLLIACGSPAPHSGRIIVAVTVDWEGAYLSQDGLDALDAIREQLGEAPVTHYVSAAYFTKAQPDPSALATIRDAVRAGDELAVHLHAWGSLATASGVPPRRAPSFLTGTDKLLEFEDGDTGFDLDLDAYEVSELRALLRRSRQLLEETRLPVSKTFRAGGFLGSRKVLQALHDEGYRVDSSAVDHRQLDEQRNNLPARVRELWPTVESTSQPFVVPVFGGSLIEMPIAAFADYAEPSEIVSVIEAAHTRLRATPERDVFVVLGFHQETGAELGPRLTQAIATLRDRPDIFGQIVFVTVEDAAGIMDSRSR